MTTVTIQEAQAQFSSLVAAAANGEEVIIAQAGTPLVKMVAMPPVEPRKPKRRLGFMEGQFKVPDDFDTMCAKEIEDMFYGEDTP